MAGSSRSGRQRQINEKPSKQASRRLASSALAQDKQKAKGVLFKFFLKVYLFGRDEDGDRESDANALPKWLRQAPAPGCPLLLSQVQRQGAGLELEQKGLKLDTHV